MISLSRSSVEAELREQRLDLRAFHRAFDILEARCFESQEDRVHPLQDWQGAGASMFTLQACIEKIRGIIGEYEEILHKMDSGEIADEDAPRRLHLVEGDGT